MRMMHNYFRIGGVEVDLPHGWIDKYLDFCDYFLTGNELKELVLLGERMPNDASSGKKWDLRKVDHYECYDEFWEWWFQKMECLMFFYPENLLDCCERNERGVLLKKQFVTQLYY
ncbi:hypothetical protein F8388_013140 [Cannabis sativa]|uniref:NADH-quinone oxidoreductase subunit D domain-containing protein n=1 Tax=Cannabis sativa TaxID=3483 RepID=A0A7J6HLV3_CANSA|nr:hypothetical protein F8388_013140 [Cannabis sativa]